MKILIDTNIYFDFYRSTNEGLNLLTEILEKSEHIILTDQIIQEFERGREKVIRDVQKNFDKESQLENFSSSFLQDYPGFKELIAIQNEYKTKRNEITAYIREILVDPSKDKVATAFKQLTDEAVKNDRLLYTTDEIIAKAQKRKLIGNPPSSDKYSIGDEINWEIILSNLKEDIILVGRDNTYNDNFSFLRKDFHRGTGRLIYSKTTKITDAFQQIGVHLSKALVDAEEELIKTIKDSGFAEYWKRKDKSEGE
ncbi:MAG: DUF4935 domain-containing protein [Chitinophaga sp.]|uniref:PIN domain-containing protein n=1 Tax=Chitinophaga sp. TaxID=1869181 RepID=UPI001B04B53F|nr:PIN domain-containing protein [Chitinophaga sp.]MBO9732599.1 DUF4935 domain-containing protein [Chitinophaga sp.]